MKNILENIYQYKIAELKDLKSVTSLSQLMADDNYKREPIDFYANLKKESDLGKTALICEVKKASPSHGVIRGDFDHLKIARIYRDSGACALSVLTDSKFFQGSPKYLMEIRKEVNLPILRKDFIFDQYQIHHAKMMGADCILLIVAMLDDQKLIELEKVALDLGLSVLVEVHNLEELERAEKLKSKIIGFNNRNLKSLEVDINNSIDLVKFAAKDCLLISESGIRSTQDIAYLKSAGINCFLIGEHFMKQDDIGSCVNEFVKS